MRVINGTFTAVYGVIRSTRAGTLTITLRKLGLAHGCIQNVMNDLCLTYKDAAQGKRMHIKVSFELLIAG